MSNHDRPASEPVLPTRIGRGPSLGHRRRRGSRSVRLLAAVVVTCIASTILFMVPAAANAIPACLFDPNGGSCNDDDDDSGGGNNPPPVDYARLEREARAEALSDAADWLAANEPSYQIWPPESAQTVHLLSFLYIPATTATQTFTGSSGSVSVTVTLDIDHSLWTFTEQATGTVSAVGCDGPGIPYQEGLTHTPCGKIFDHSSAVTGKVDMEVAVVYEVAWSSSRGNSGTLPNAATEPAKTELTVNEVLSYGYRNEGSGPTAKKPPPKLPPTKEPCIFAHPDDILPGAGVACLDDTDCDDGVKSATDGVIKKPACTSEPCTPLAAIPGTGTFPIIDGDCEPDCDVLVVPDVVYGIRVPGAIAGACLDDVIDDAGEDCDVVIPETIYGLIVPDWLAGACADDILEDEEECRFEVPEAVQGFDVPDLFAGLCFDSDNPEFVAPTECESVTFPIFFCTSPPDCEEGFVAALTCGPDDENGCFLHPEFIACEGVCTDGEVSASCGFPCEFFDDRIPGCHLCPDGETIGCDIYDGLGICEFAEFVDSVDCATDACIASASPCVHPYFEGDHGEINCVGDGIEASNTLGLCVQSGSVLALVDRNEQLSHLLAAQLLANEAKEKCFVGLTWICETPPEAYSTQIELALEAFEAGGGCSTFGVEITLGGVTCNGPGLGEQIGDVVVEVLAGAALGVVCVGVTGATGGVGIALCGVGGNLVAGAGANVANGDPVTDGLLIDGLVGLVPGPAGPITSTVVGGVEIIQGAPNDDVDAELGDNVDPENGLDGGG